MVANYFCNFTVDFILRRAYEYLTGKNSSVLLTHILVLNMLNAYPEVRKMKLWKGNYRVYSIDHFIYKCKS